MRWPGVSQEGEYQYQYHIKLPMSIGGWDRWGDKGTGRWDRWVGQGDW